MPEPTDPTGAWITRLLEVSGKERVERLSAMTPHEKDAVLLRLLTDRSERNAKLTRAINRLIERVDTAIAQLTLEITESEVDGG